MMKKIAIIILILYSAAIAYAETLVATTNAVSVPAPTAYGLMFHVAVDNLGTNTIFAMPNIGTTGVVKTNYYGGSANVTTGACFVATNATAIGPGKSFSFPVHGKAGNDPTPITNIVISAESGTNTLVYIGFNK